MTPITAMPAAEPSWTVVLTIPEADPACRAGTRARVMVTMVAETQARPMPAPTMEGSRCHGLRPAPSRSSVTVIPTTLPPVASDPLPATVLPSRGARRVAIAEPRITPKAKGRKVRAACRGVYPRAICRWSVKTKKKPPLPAEQVCLDEQAAEQGPAHTGQGQHHAVQAERPGAVLGREGDLDEGEHLGDHQRGHRALQDAAGDQGLRILRRSGQGRGEGEAQDADDEGPPAAEDVADAAAR